VGPRRHRDARLLAGWLRARGLLEPEEDVTGDDFVAARELRGALRALALLNTTGESADGDLRERIAGALAECRLAVDVDSGGRLVPVPAGAAGARALARIATVVLEAQAAGTWSRLKACRKESCRWLFYDGSRNRSSSWCSMSICGNRVKTAEYRRRRREAS
jgi:predicted RNA-binding Zn ribbon-like protein